MKKEFEKLGNTLKPTVLFILGHILLGLLIRKNPMFSTMHALLVTFLGITAALKRNSKKAICIIAYIAGAEILWRMTEANIFWEYGKLSVFLIIIIGLLVEKKKAKNTSPLYLYLILLLPAILYAPGGSFAAIRNRISFNMSGPVSLAFCGIYLSRMSLNSRELKNVFTSFCGPIFSIATIAYWGIKVADSNVWGGESSFMASGGYGPNQVSSVLGLGTFFCIAMLFFIDEDKKLKIFFFLGALWMFSQALLTFSRGGALQGVISIAIFFIFLFKAVDFKKSIGIVFFAVFLIVGMQFYLLPKLDKITGGKLSKRYEQKEKIGDVKVYKSTGRADFIMMDIEIFQKTIFGVGVGGTVLESVRKIDPEIEPHTAHTEWSRMLSDHGILGLFSMIFLITWIVGKCKRKNDPVFKALLIALAVNGAFYMCHASMRTVIPAVLFGFLGINFVRENFNAQDF